MTIKTSHAILASITLLLAGALLSLGYGQMLQQDEDDR